MNWRPPLGPRGGPVFPDFEFEARDRQLPPDFRKPGSPDVSTAAMEAAPAGEPPSPYDVRCVYDSRPPNGFDFNVSQYILNALTTAIGSAIVVFNVPPGYRWVPREFDVTIMAPIAAAINSVTASVQANGANVPYNQQIAIGGSGTSAPIKTFFLVDENQTFGLQVALSGIVLTGAHDLLVNVYGNVLPVTDVSLPYEVTNKVRT